MSNPQLKQMLQRSDRGVNSVDDSDGGLLAKFMRLIFKDNSLTWMSWDRLFKEYFNKNPDIVQFDDNGKAVTNRSLRGNLQKNMARGSITWSSFLRVLRIMGVLGVEFSAVLYYKKDKRPTYHSLFMPLDEDDTGLEIPYTELLEKKQSTSKEESLEHLTSEISIQIEKLYEEKYRKAIETGTLSPELKKASIDLFNEQRDAMLEDIEQYVAKQLKGQKLYNKDGKAITVIAFNKDDYNDRI